MGVLVKEMIGFCLIRVLVPYKLFYVQLNPWIPMSDRDRISPYNINQIRDENKENYQFGDN